MKKYLFIFVFMAFIPSVIHGKQTAEVAADKVRTALLKQLEIYPQSRLSDIYKFFFQDKFGPGHLLSDTARAGAYIRSELAQMEDVTYSPDIDSIGWEQNFVRVNLVLVKKGVITYGQLFRAFTESMKRELPDISGWREEWNAIRKIASGIRVKRVGGSVVPDENGERLCDVLPGFREDERNIRRQLKKGRYVGHHSDAFEKAYAPHYRIVSKSIYERTIKPLLGDNRGIRDVW